MKVGGAGTDWEELMTGKNTRSRTQTQLSQQTAKNKNKKAQTAKGIKTNRWSQGTKLFTEKHRFWHELIRNVI